MDSKQQGFKLPSGSMGSNDGNFKVPSLSMGSNDGNSERQKPPAPKKMKSLTLFDDLLDNLGIENLHSRTNSEDQGQKDSSHSEYGSGVSATVNEPKFWLSNGFVKINDRHVMYGVIKKKLVSSLNPTGLDAQVESIYRDVYASVMSRAKLHSFGIYSAAIQTKCGGDANVKYAWYGASKNEISGILSHGFRLPLNNGVYGHGVYLATVDHPLESLQSSTADEDGLRHMLICRVILGKLELISPGSGLYNPSSQEFDSGVDNLVSPKKYIIWNAKMNTHILPEFVVSFRTSSHSRGSLRVLQPPKNANSDRIPFPILIKRLSLFLPAGSIKLLAKNLNYYNKRKIARHEMIQGLRYIVGDRLLMAMIKSHTKRIEASGSVIAQAPNPEASGSGTSQAPIPEAARPK